MPAKPVGAPKKTVGLRAARRPALEDRVGRRPLGHQHAPSRRPTAETSARCRGRRRSRAWRPRSRRRARSARAPRLPYSSRRPVGVGVRVHRALRACRSSPTNRARRPGRRRRSAAGRGSGSARATQRVESTAPRAAVRRARRRSASAPRAALCAIAGSQRRQQRRRHERRLRAAVLEHVGVVVRGEQRVDRDRHDAGVEAPRKATGQSLLSSISSSTRSSRRSPRPRKRRREPAHAVGELAVGQLPRVVDVGDLRCARGVRLQQVIGEIEPRRRRQALPPRACRAGTGRGNCSSGVGGIVSLPQRFSAAAPSRSSTATSACTAARR